MRLTQGVIEELSALLTSTPVGSACEGVGVSVGSYYRWHWESCRLSRRRLPNAVDTAYETQKTSLLQRSNISIVIDEPKLPRQRRGMWGITYSTVLAWVFFYQCHPYKKIAEKYIIP